MQKGKILQARKGEQKEGKMTNLKTLFKEVKEAKARAEKERGEKNEPALSIELFDAGNAYGLRKEELIALLQEAIYLLRDKDKNAENELMEAVEEWHPEFF